MYKVAILLSTYNGERFIEEQIRSIIYQNNVEVNLFVRDDGSTDNTINIIKSFKERIKISIIQGDNLRSARSFLNLMEHVFKTCKEYDYYALCDQDDVWDCNKIITAIEMLKERQGDLYFSSLKLLSNNREINGKIKNCPLLSKKELMLRNTAAGCTMVFKYDLLKLICSYHPDWIEMHDSWIIRVAVYTGNKIVSDKVPHMSYRIHSNNVCGVSYNMKTRIKSSFASFRKNDNTASKTATELLKGFSARMELSDVEYLNWISNVNKYKNTRFLFSKFIRMQDFISSKNYYIFILKLFAGKI